MANISHDAVLSAVWMLMRRAREAGAASDGSETQAGCDEGHAEETVKNLISAYLRPATHISSHFQCW